jgi:DNA-binding transcriptional LysR family regulator
MSTIDLFNDVPAFVAVVEAGSFADAARRLHLSRSAVGKAVARLEERLNVRLFQRTTRSNSLTDDGQIFYEHCQQAMTALQSGKAQIETGRESVTGRLCVTMPVLFGRMYVAPILMELAAANPDLSLELDFRDHHLDLIDAGMDLAIRNGPIGLGTGLQARRIARHRSLICAAPSYVERYGVLGTLDDLHRHVAINYRRDGRSYLWEFLRADGTPDELIPPASLCLNDLGAMLDAVVAGQGLAWLPEWLVADRVARGELINLLPELNTRLKEIHLIWPGAPHMPTRVRVAIELLAHSLSTASWSISTPADAL